MGEFLALSFRNSSGWLKFWELGRVSGSEVSLRGLTRNILNAGRCARATLWGVTEVTFFDWRPLNGRKWPFCKFQDEDFYLEKSKLTFLAYLSTISAFLCTFVM